MNKNLLITILAMLMLILLITLIAMNPGFFHDTFLCKGVPSSAVNQDWVDKLFCGPGRPESNG